jgi:hypothetical protein
MLNTNIKNSYLARRNSMKKKLISTLVSFAVILNLFPLTVVVQATENNANTALNEALKQKTFYHYNMAYFEIDKLQNEAVKNEMLGKLSAIAGEIWTNDIKNINSMIHEMAQNSSGKIYDQVQVVINKSNVQEVDKQYLLGEVTSWGKRLVWTSDYANGVQAIVDTWNNMSGTNIKKAQLSVDGIANRYSKDYLNEELQSIKNLYYNNSDNFIKRLNYLKVTTELSDEEIISEVRDLFANTSLINLPAGYINNDEFYLLLTFIGQFEVPSDTISLQDQLIKYVAIGEAAKFQGNIYTKKPIKLSANTSNLEIDVTDKVVKPLMPVINDVKYSIVTAGYNPIVNIVGTSEYLAVRDGRVYLKPKAVEKTDVTEYIKYSVTYKGFTFDSAIEVSIVPEV